MKKAGLVVFLFLVSLLLFSQETTEVPPAEPAAETTGAENAAAENTEEPGAAADGAEETEEPEIAAEPETPEPKERTLEDKGMDPASVLERDINTATVEELADWCRSLGLGVDGGKETLAARLREYHKLSPPAQVVVEEEGKEPLIITIEYAKTTEYFTVESIDEEYVRLRGGVSVTLKDGDTLHQIQAEEILYNRTREMMTASGGVSYVKKDSSQNAGEETRFRGEGLTVNLNNWSTAFMQGVSERSSAGNSSPTGTSSSSADQTSYRFAGEVISRSGDDSIVLRKAKITNANQEEPYWSIDATRLWLLPGSDFAILNAVIKVGEIPVLYFPAFYYPGSEVIFRPVLGIRSREGTFLQTTTYILGRPTTTTTSSSTEQNSFSSFMGSNEGMETKREGIFLRSTGRKAPSGDEPILYLMTDAYSNLGYFLGSELSLPAKNHFGKSLFALGLGFSRDIIYGSGVNNYSPFDYDGTSTWHQSSIFGNEIPFPLRYRFSSTGSVSGSGKVARSANLSWQFPLYSDPYMENDFINNRSMDSNLFNLLKNANKVDVDGVTTDAYVGSYNWTLNGGLSFATTPLNPYVNEFAITSIASSVGFEVRSTDPRPTVSSGSLSFSPRERFFFPGKFTIFSATGSIGGTPLTLGGTASTQPKPETTEEETEWGKPFSPWEDDEEDDKEDNGDPLALRPPKLTRTVSSTVLGGSRFTLGYSISPTASSEIKFNSGPSYGNEKRWKNEADVDWSDWAHQIFTYHITGTVTLSLTGKQNLYSQTLSVTGKKSGQDNIYLNEESADYDTQLERDNMEKQARNITFFISSGTYTFTLTPFVQSNVWKNTNLQYNLQGLVYEKKYNPEREVDEEKWAEWTQEKITTNSLSANIRANVMDQQQSLSLTANLPPEKYDESKYTNPVLQKKVPTITGNLALNAWISQTTVGSSVEDPFEIPYYNEISFTETLRFPKNVTLSHTMRYAPENQESDRKPTPDKPGFKAMNTTLNSTQSWGTLSAAFRAARAKPYYLDTAPGQTGWKQSTDDERLIPQALGFTFNSTQLSFKKWGDFEVAADIRTNLNFDLMRYTNSEFNFRLSTTVKIARFLDLTLVSNSYNKQIYRYFRNMPFFDPVDVEIPGEKNFFIDLFNSFRFDDIEKRQASGFKLSSFDFKLTHYLGDWDAILEVKLYPELDKSTTPYEYKFKSNIGFLIQWKPIKEFKTEMKYTTDDGFSY